MRRQYKVWAVNRLNQSDRQYAGTVTANCVGQAESEAAFRFCDRFHTKKFYFDCVAEQPSRTPEQVRGVLCFMGGTR
jgi:hypothetical protein